MSEYRIQIDCVVDVKSEKKAQRLLDRMQNVVEARSVDWSSTLGELGPLTTDPAAWMLRRGRAW